MSTTQPIVIPTLQTDPIGPADGLADLRRQQPLCRLRYTNGEAGWLVTSHTLAKAVLTDRRFGRGDLGAHRDRTATGDPARIADFELALKPYDGWRPMRGFILMDPPDHTRFRRFLAPYFTAGRIADFRPRISQIVSERLDVLEREDAPSDLVSTFASPVSLHSQCALLGIPATQVSRFFRLGSVIADPSVPPTEVVAAWRDAWEYVRDLTEERREQPTDDLLSDIASSQELTDEEIADTALVLFQGGLETTGDMLALAVLILLCHPDELARLQDDAELMGMAVEELLRYAGIFRLVSRTALEDVQLNDVLIRTGETVTISLASANRDPEKFAHPDRLDLRRVTHGQGHLAFAHGIHVCIGQHLARIELQVALAALFSRFPTLHLAGSTDELSFYGPHLDIYGVHALPVAW